MYSEFKGNHVIVRSSPSGVWLGVLEEINDRSTVRLRDARRVWRWEGAGSCSGLATHGPSGGLITAAISRVLVMDVCEILLVTPDALARFAAVEPWIA